MWTNLTIKKSEQRPRAEAHSVFSQTSKMGRFATIANGFQPLIIVANLPILDICRSAGCASHVYFFGAFVVTIRSYSARLSQMSPFDTPENIIKSEVF